MAVLTLVTILAENSFKYSIKKEMSANPVKDGSDKFESVKTGDYGKFDSQCDKTMIGFV
jgi:hypothetical protein